MSLDERMRAGLRAVAASQPIDSRAAWEKVRMHEQRERSGRRVALLVAAAVMLVAAVVWGPGIIDSLSGQSSVVPIEQPTDSVVVNAACEPAPPEEVDHIVGAGQANWTGPGELTVTDAQVVLLDPPVGSLSFKRVTYLLARVDGGSPQVYVFAGNSPYPWRDGQEGMLFGADSVTRDAFVWGQETVEGSLIDDEVQASVEAAGSCF